MMFKKKHLYKKCVFKYTVKVKNKVGKKIELKK